MRRKTVKTGKSALAYT